ncbi:MAG: tRNA preQ1(34) S-adenosylmethionine ribosyltransferase-isomerase QueA, partial [Alphaproteobacteria bacterium]|nr:tRNA preQ1(34) S-adenosylmethionine ribosyltransferase-isomerase QueA [Alphaproteobacteria bacterium]
MANKNKMLHTSDFDFELPSELIASHPLEKRDASRMLVIANGKVCDKHIRDFLDYLEPGDVVVFNNSRVIPARFNAVDMSGNFHEITLHTATDDNHIWWGLCKKFNKFSIGDVLTMDDGTNIEIVDTDEESGVKIAFHCDDVFQVLDRVGKMPLPPYMKRDEELNDRERYQTVYADPIGSMAAPTAGLHFTDELMHEIESRGAQVVKVTLHVGAGTWMPVKTEDLSMHKMHSEWCQITPEQADIINGAKRVIAVGTTSMRTLESAAIDNRNLPENKRNKRIVPICRT